MGTFAEPNGFKILDAQALSTGDFYSEIITVSSHQRDVAVQVLLSSISAPTGSIKFEVCNGDPDDGWPWIDAGGTVLNLATIAATSPYSAIFYHRDTAVSRVRVYVECTGGTCTIDANAHVVE